MGVLVAVSIPIFTAQLNKAKYATDEANARSIYAELTADYLASGGAAQGVAGKTIQISATSVTEDTAATITTTAPDGSTNEYKFSGIVGITFHLGTDTAAPYVEVAECDKAGAAAVTFGQATTTTNP